MKDKLFKDIKKKDAIIYIVTVILGCLFIFFGHMIASANQIKPTDTGMPNLQKAYVVSVDTNEKGETVFDFFFTDKDDEARHTAVQNDTQITREVKPGETVFVTDMSGKGEYIFADYPRIDKIIILAVIFLALVIVFAGRKGVSTVISLLFTLMSIFYVFLPAILSQYNVYLWGIISCIAIVIFTLIIVHGFNLKSLASGLGTIGGIIIATIIMVISSHFLDFTGLISDDAMYLQFNSQGFAFNLKAIFFTMIIIGALGAIMDVAMSIATSMYEIKEIKPNITTKEMIKSGFEIGKDILGTMTNTLILAYVGSGFLTVIVIVGFNTDLLQIFNKEFLVSEIFQPLIGSFGIVVTLPLTSIICAKLFEKIKKKENKDELVN